MAYCKHQTSKCWCYAENETLKTKISNKKGFFCLTLLQFITFYVFEYIIMLQLNVDK